MPINTNTEEKRRANCSYAELVLEIVSKENCIVAFWISLN